MAQENEQATIQRLEKENQSLRIRNMRLKGENKDLKKIGACSLANPSLVRGFEGETHMAKALGGKLGPYFNGHDVLLANGMKIEVKVSKVKRPNEKRGIMAGRWNWSALLGGDKIPKAYDYLILIGDKDPLYMSQYPEPKDPFVYFMVPFKEVHLISSKSRMRGKLVGAQTQLKTDLESIIAPKPLLLKNYMVSLKDIKSFFKEPHDAKA